MTTYDYASRNAGLLCAGLASIFLLTAVPTPAPAEDHEIDDLVHQVVDEEEDDLFRRHLFEPEEILERGQALGLTPEQREAMIEDVVGVQAAVSRMELEAVGELGRLHDLLERDPIAEAEAVALAESLLRLEQNKKLRYFGLLVRLRNALTPEQRARLAGFRAE